MLWKEKNILHTLFAKKCPQFFIAHLWFAKWDKFQIDELFKMAIVGFQLIFNKADTIWAQWFVINCYMHLQILCIKWRKKVCVSHWSVCEEIYKEIFTVTQITLFWPNTKCGTNAIKTQQNTKRTEFIVRQRRWRTVEHNTVNKQLTDRSHESTHKTTRAYGSNSVSSQVQPM